jgi:lipoprotein-releasing system permease protein
MALPYELWIALRYLRGRRRERFISLITWISVGGVALGVTALVVVLSVMTGFEEDLRDKILGANAHLVVQSMGGLLTDSDRVIREVGEVRGVTGATPFAVSQVMISAGGSVQGAMFRGIDPQTVGKVLDLERFLQGRKLENLDGDTPGLLVGQEMARNMGLFVGDRLQVISPVGSATPIGMVPRIRSFRVAGIFVSGMYEYDTSYVFASLRPAQDFLRLGSAVTGVEIRVRDIYDAPKMARAIEARLGAGYFARDWTDLNRNLFSALKLEKAAMFVILTLIVLVAAFNIASTLIMVVLEKSREIGILKSMGAPNRSIRKIFISEGLVIGGLGTALGLLGGWTLCVLLQRYKFVELPRQIYYIDTLPVVISFPLFALVALSAVALSLAATAYPSWQASRLDPIDTLRYE